MVYEEYLAHYGIKGQKWGIRRFQNEDGSLTYAGKLRYLKLSEKKNLKKSVNRGQELINKGATVKNTLINGITKTAAYSAGAAAFTAFDTAGILSVAMNSILSGSFSSLMLLGSNALTGPLAIALGGITVGGIAAGKALSKTIKDVRDIKRAKDRNILESVVDRM